MSVEANGLSYICLCLHLGIAWAKGLMKSHKVATAAAAAAAATATAATVGN